MRFGKRFTSILGPKDTPSEDWPWTRGDAVLNESRSRPWRSTDNTEVPFVVTMHIQYCYGFKYWMEVQKPLGYGSDSVSWLCPMMSIRLIWWWSLQCSVHILRHERSRSCKFWIMLIPNHVIKEAIKVDTMFKGQSCFVFFLLSFFAPCTSDEMALKPFWADKYKITIISVNNKWKWYVYINV